MKRIPSCIPRSQFILLALVSQAYMGAAQTKLPSAPLSVRQWLQRNDCRIHQPSKDPLEVQIPPASLTSGRFRGTPQPDWAALCVMRDSSLLLVFRGGRADRIDTLEIGTSPLPAGRGIRAAPASEVRMYSSMLGDSIAADTVWMTHDGIVDSEGCCGIVWFWHQGRWRQLPGLTRSSAQVRAAAFGKHDSARQSRPGFMRDFHASPVLG